MTGIRNPSGVVMSRVKAVVSSDELTAIFVNLNQLDKACEEKLWSLTQEQRAAVIAPGVYLQNVRNGSTAVKSRIANVLAGRSAMERPARAGTGGAGTGSQRPRSKSKRRRSSSSSASGSGSEERRRKRRRH